MKSLPPFTMVHRPTPAPKRVGGARRGGRKRTPPFHALDLAAFRLLVAHFPFKRSINSVHLHHSKRPNHAQYDGTSTLEVVWRSHVGAGWSDIAQHVSIAPDGTIWTGRNWNTPPASADGHNGNASFGPFMVVIIGDFDQEDVLKNPQKAATLKVIAIVQRRFGLSPSSLVFHRQMSGHDCPGTTLEHGAWIEELVRLHAASDAAPDNTEAAPRQVLQDLLGAPSRRERSTSEPREYEGLEPDSSEPGLSVLERLRIDHSAHVPWAPEASAIERSASAFRKLTVRKFPGRLADSPASVSAKSLRVGLWDLDAYVGGLPRVVEALNSSQSTYTFFETMAAIPAGLLSSRARVQRWWFEKTGDRKRMSDVDRNIIAEEYFKRAERVRRDLGIDYLAGITACMIADEGEEDINYNLLASSHGRLLLTSTFGLRAHAKKAKRVFEVAAIGIVVAQLLVTRFARLGYHDDRGCLFDYNREHANIVKVLRRPHIEPSCLSLIPAASRPDILAMVNALDQFRKEDLR